MRSIFLLRGAPGSGKSTWIKNNHLEPYTLSADNIRQSIAGLTYNMDGERIIPQDHDGQVWRLLLKLLEERMDRGEFVIVDATHYRAALLQQYKNLITTYRYRAYVVDFTDVPEEEALRRNSLREKYKFVPAERITKIYTVFRSNYKEVSNKFNIITREQAEKLLADPLLFDYNHYKKVVVFGDIHGCYEPVKAYFDQNPFENDVSYIFTGDFLDRGIQNKEVVQFLLSIYDRRNVLLLEGNHERWLRMFAEEEDKQMTPEEQKMLRPYVDKEYWENLRRHQIRNIGFRKNTAVEIADVSKKELRKMCRRIGQIAYIDYHGKHYYISHGGTPMLPSLFVPSEQYIHGVGSYEDVDALYESWMKNTGENEILIHAHRNPFGYPVKINERCYNLCDSVEFGKCLRVIELTEAGIKTIEIPNTVFDKQLAEAQQQKLAPIVNTASDVELIKQLNATNLVQKKVFDNGIVSYNFTRTAFSDARWNYLTCTARGLFVKDDKVVARSYDKFFNWGERENVSERALREHLVFPVTAYEKENGFLALVTSYEGELLCCSKSSLEGPYVGYIKDIIDKLWSDSTKEAVREYAEKNNCTFVFECVDAERDPHIIQYKDKHLYLLDIVQNDFTFHSLKYSEMRALAEKLGLETKKVAVVFQNWHELYEFFKKSEASFDPYHPGREGWVFVDSNNFMVKLKTPTYRWWKVKRGVMNSLQAGHTVKPVYQCSADIELFSLMNRLKDEGRLEGMSILDVQKEFWKEHSSDS